MWECAYGSSSIDAFIKKNNMTAEWIKLDDYGPREEEIDEILESIKRKSRSKIIISL